MGQTWVRCSSSTRRKNRKRSPIPVSATTRLLIRKSMIPWMCFSWEFLTLILGMKRRMKSQRKQTSEESRNKYGCSMIWLKTAEQLVPRSQSRVSATMHCCSTVHIRINVCTNRIPSDMMRLHVCILHRGGYMGMFPNSRLAKRLAGRYNKSSRVDDWCKQEPSEDDPKRLIRCPHLLISQIVKMAQKSDVLAFSRQRSESPGERGARNIARSKRSRSRSRGRQLKEVSRQLQQWLLSTVVTLVWYIGDETPEAKGGGEGAVGGGSAKDWSQGGAFGGRHKEHIWKKYFFED